MCFKKKYPTEPIVDVVEHRLVTTCRNVYGGGNDLRGCLNDGTNFMQTFPKIIPGIAMHRYFDYDATEKNYLESLEQSIGLLRPGATVVVIMDSCYSGTATRNGLLSTYNKSRFINPGGPVPEGKVRRVARTDEMKWIAISAASENQTASDAKIGNEYVGAFSYYAYKTLKPGMTWRKWFNAIRLYLPSGDFSQIPTIEGPDYLLDRIIGQHQELIAHNSSHGSWVIDKSGDEADGRDEGLYLDRFISDDKINVILQRIVL